MKRGDLYRVYKGSKRVPKKYRVFVVISRQVLIDSKFSTVICAPIYSNYSGISTQVPVGTREGLKHDSCIYCDELISIPKNILTNYVGTLSYEKVIELNEAIRIALAIEDDSKTIIQKCFKRKTWLNQ
ncbi:MAG: type II toxin-antitoxin system PemK/MazF family toxin [Candidatus Aminicenantes bacterium]|nr:type II toxin-antitoxin system PemK/MazF family toxin [Candidatus Aminicenantes bacterium]